MITEDSISENPEKKTSNTPEDLQEHVRSEEQTSMADDDSETTQTTQETTVAAEEEQNPQSAHDAQTLIGEAIIEESSDEDLVTSEETLETAPPAESPKPEVTDQYQHLTLPQTLDQMELIVNKANAGSEYKDFARLRERAQQIIQQETEAKKTADEEDYQHPQQAKLSGLTSIFREKQDHFQKEQEANHAKNLEERNHIIEKLKNLYTNTEAGTNLFKAIREIKEEWKNAGQVPKSEFKLVNNNYFHHLNQFYQMLDMNKEYLEQEYTHNLEKRQHIISRARELETEPAVQKALNELQYLHKLWKEEAEPVAEEFRETTWDEFKEISNRIHERRSELSAQIEEEQNKNLERKNEIIETIKKFLSPEKEPNHSYWQNAIKKVEDLRSEFLKIGSVPRKISNQNWNEFKQHLREFNSKKNEFYRGLKNSQQQNLEQKLALVETAKANMMSEDWDVIVPLFKKLQDDWKKIGHVPRSMTNKIWDDFRGACNVFFNNYREKNDVAADNWKDNFKQKAQLLEELKAVGNEEGSVEAIERLKNAWNAIGKVPRDKISINSEFNKVLREKLRLNKVESYALKEEHLSENQLTDKARKIKNQIADLEAEIVKLENNVGFFSNSSRDNPLLKDTFANIDDKKQQLADMKKSLHNILSGENQ